MGSGMRGYWTLTWFGLISNTLAIPFIAYVAFLKSPPLQTTNAIKGIASVFEIKPNQVSVQ